MTEEEFLSNIVSPMEVYYTPEKKKRERYYKPNPAVRKKDFTINDFLYEKWRTGGQGGGSCYGNDYYAIEGEPEPELLDLDIFLEKIVPDISYLKYKALTKDLVEYESYEEGEYYGNSTVYGTKKIVLKKLYDKMVELQLI